MSPYVLVKAKRHLASLLGGLLLVSMGASSEASPMPHIPSLAQFASPQLAARMHVSLAVQHSTRAAQRNANTPPGDQALPLARQAMREARPTRARYLAMFSIAHAEDGSDAQIHAQQLAGYASWIAKDYSGAIEHLLAVEQQLEDDLLAPWRRAWLADAYFRVGDDHEAIRWAAMSAQSSTRYHAYHLAQAASARAHARMSDAPDPRTLMEFLDRYPEYPEYRDARAELALSWIAVGNLQRAAEEIDYARQQYPWSPQAQRLERVVKDNQALEALLPVYSSAERLERAREWRMLRQWPTAEDALLRLESEALARHASPEELGPIRLELAVNAMKAGDYELAHQRFEALDRDNWPGVTAWEGLRDYGWNMARRDHHLAGLEILRRSAKARGGQGETDSLFEYLYDFGHFSEARGLLDEISRSQRPDAFTTIMMTYLASDYESAARQFTALARRSNSHGQLQANYWAARAELHMGQVTAARARFEEIVRSRPHDYYGLLAASRLADLDAEAQHEDSDPGTIKLRRLPGRMHWHGADDRRPADFHVVADQAGHMSAYSKDLPPSKPLAESIEPWKALFPDLERAYQLSLHGADEEARLVFRSVVLEITRLRAARGRPSATKPLSLPGDLWEHWTDNRPTDKRGWWGIPLSTPAYSAPTNDKERRAAAQRQREILDAGTELTDALIDIGRQLEDHHVVRRLVQRERGLSGHPPTEGERRDWLEAYPRPFPSTVVAQTQRANLNPYLLWALIIVESDMNPDAISRADAYGLTQVIPKTADRLAWEIGDTSFGIHALLDPHLSIRYGAWYFGGLVHKFHNQESLALIGYNAGPHRVARWLDWRGAELDYDEFLEMVPFPGARNYHKRILRYAATYQMLYEGELQIYIGLDLDTSYDPTINF